VVLSGLAEGEAVVVNGAFKIDSAMQIQAKPSMMNPPAPSTRPQEDGTARPVISLDAPDAFQDQLGLFTDAYVQLTTALAADDEEAAHDALTRMNERLAAVDMTLLGEGAHMEWMGLLRDLRPALEQAGSAEDLDGLRTVLPRLTSPLKIAIEVFGVGNDRRLLLYHCPMAFDGAGADWIQTSTTTANPYYGAAMLRCGDVKQRLSGEEGE
jgi:Cu(I)/Ag(I) efflux system membrane fusion protein